MQKKLEAAMETGYLRWTSGFKRHSVYWKEKENEKEKSGLMENPVDHADVLTDPKHKLKFDPVIHGDDKLLPRSNSKVSKSGSRAGSKSAKKDRLGVDLGSVPKIGKIQSQMIKSPKIQVEEVDSKPQKMLTKKKTSKNKDGTIKKQASSKFKPKLGLAKKKATEDVGFDTDS